MRSWFEMLGLQSSGPRPAAPDRHQVHADKEHPITKGMADWTTINEELYNNVQVLTGKAIANGTAEAPRSGKTRSRQGHPRRRKPPRSSPGPMNTAPRRPASSATTIGHNNATVEDARYLDMVARAVLWSVNKIDANGKASCRFRLRKPSGK